MAAVSLKHAAGLSSQSVQLVLQTVGQSLRTRLDSWVRAIAAIVPDEDSIANRTVTNWIPRGNEIIDATSTTENQQTQTDANLIALYVWQTCTAADQAALATPPRITSAQATALLGQFNAIWP
jgi:hypothetical protein